MTPERKYEVMQINKLHHEICHLSSVEYNRIMASALKAACERLSLALNYYNKEKLLDEATVYFRYITKVSESLEESIQ